LVYRFDLINLFKILYKNRAILVKPEQAVFRYKIVFKSWPSEPADHSIADQWQDGHQSASWTHGVVGKTIPCSSTLSRFRASTVMYALRLAGNGPEQGYQIRRILLKFVEIRRIRSDSNSKITELLFINSKKIRKYIKKLDEILKLLMKKCFQIDVFWLVKI
jgi:hypothetical protein